MADRSLRSEVGEAAWNTLRLSVILVCRDALSGADDDTLKWARLATLLRRIGAQAVRLEHDGDLALCVLADFTDDDVCRDVIARARDLVAGLPESDLRKFTKTAAKMVDLKCPDQSFRFRVTLILVSMIASGTSEWPELSGLANVLH